MVVLVFLKLKPASTEMGPLTEKLKSLDAIGFTLFAGSVTMLLLALQWGGTTYAWKSSVVIGLFIGFGIVMSVFAVWQTYLQDDALIPPKISTNRNVALIFLSALLANGPFQTVCILPANMVSGHSWGHTDIEWCQISTNSHCRRIDFLRLGNLSFRSVLPTTFPK